MPQKSRVCGPEGSRALRSATVTVAATESGMACGPLPLTTSLTVMASWCGGNSFDWRAAAKGAHIPHAAPDGLSPMVAGRAPMKEDCLPKEKADVTPLMPPTGTLALREKRLRRVAGWSGALASLFGISPCSV